MTNPFIENLVTETTKAIRFYTRAHATNDAQAEELFTRYRQLFINAFIDSMHTAEAPDED